MGRTNPTYRDRLSAIEDRWNDYRRTLRRRDQHRFDRLFVYARDHADAAGMLNHEDRLAPILLSIALEQERRLDELEERVDEIESRGEELPGTDEELPGTDEELPGTDRELLQTGDEPETTDDTDDGTHS